MFKPQALTLLLLTLTLAGCESMSESECRTADWGRVGLADGSRGETERRLADYTEDCGKIGVVPNARAYRQGWDNGIQRFCTAANGWREGVAGHSGKAEVCVGQAGYASFARYLDAGLQVYRTQERIQRNTQESNRLQKKLESATTDEEKRQIRRQLQDIDRDQFHLRNQMGQQQLLAP
ncbi:DUF2799 domain-containing protein [Rhodoferax sp.]|uniref:DUF2799 domain-containing protein n=1 Tax=Rhodoferax sp. TaxID=50421 RepID=UPI0026362E90|nr:DUF2799 domain-containing protein [Rhodoferax sp.]MDD2923794.1 DUF2799 domain-containing protein [Rhodoferax sp.]